MKSKRKVREFPAVSKTQIQERLPKTEAILLRLSVHDKTGITETAKSVHLTATEYLVKCHEVVSEKLADKGKL